MDIAVTIAGVMGFTFIASFYPMPFSVFPLIAALIVPSDPVTGAFAGMICTLFFGTVAGMIKASR